MKGAPSPLYISFTQVRVLVRGRGAQVLRQRAKDTAVGAQGSGETCFKRSIPRPSLSKAAERGAVGTE